MLDARIIALERQRAESEAIVRADALVEGEEKSKDKRRAQNKQKGVRMSVCQWVTNNHFVVFFFFYFFNSHRQGQLGTIDEAASAAQPELSQTITFFHYRRRAQPTAQRLGICGEHFLIVFDRSQQNQHYFLFSSGFFGILFCV